MAVNKSNRGPRGHMVEPLSSHKIRSTVMDIRKLLSIPEGEVDIIYLYEFKLTQYGFVYDICDKEEMGRNHGLTIPDENMIKIREDVYDGACDGVGRDRFTLCHEFGHLVLHSEVSFARTQMPANHEFYEDSEWQADTFAAEFMMPVKEIQCHCAGPDDISRRFGVSEPAAYYRWDNLMKKGLISKKRV